MNWESDDSSLPNSITPPPHIGGRLFGRAGKQAF